MIKKIDGKNIFDTLSSHYSHFLIFLIVNFITTIFMIVIALVPLTLERFFWKLNCGFFRIKINQKSWFCVFKSSHTPSSYFVLNLRQWNISNKVFNNELLIQSRYAVVWNARFHHQGHWDFVKHLIKIYLFKKGYINSSWITLKLIIEACACALNNLLWYYTENVVSMKVRGRRYN